MMWSGICFLFLSLHIPDESPVPSRRPPRRRSVVEISRALKELFHEARERASKALGFAKMLRKVSSRSGW